MHISFLTFLLFIISASHGWACSCTAPNKDSSKEAFAQSDVVIDAEIISASKGWSEIGPLLKVRSNKIYKGENIPDIMMINYNDHTAACGNQFKSGDNAILAIYDTRSVNLDDNNTRGYGFRLMVSCQQSQVRHYIKKYDLPDMQSHKKGQ